VTSRSVHDEQAFLESLAEAICRRRLRAPTLLLLDAGQPLALLAAQLLWIAQPTLGLLGSRRRLGRLAELLERPAGVQALITAIEGHQSS
jgi:hypothetical protein